MDSFRDVVKQAQSEEYQRKLDHPHRSAVRDQEIAAEMRMTMRDDPARRNDYVRDMVEWSRVHRTIAARDNNGFIRVDRTAAHEALAAQVQVGRELLQQQSPTKTRERSVGPER
jgi:predicted ATP-dependent protease